MLNIGARDKYQGGINKMNMTLISQCTPLKGKKPDLTKTFVFEADMNPMDKIIKQAQIYNILENTNLRFIKDNIIEPNGTEVWILEVYRN